MATQTGGNVDLKLLDLQNDIVKNLINYINENSNILSQTISQDKHNIEVIKQRINNLINSGVGEWSEIIDARRGFSNLTDSINRASVGYYPYDPPTDKAEYSFWINSVNKKAYMLLSDSPIAWIQIGQQDVIDKFMDLLYNKANIEVNLGTDLNKHVESLDCTWTNGIEVEKIEGQFKQNLISKPNTETDYNFIKYGTPSIAFGEEEITFNTNQASHGIGIGCYNQLQGKKIVILADIKADVGKSFRFSFYTNTTATQRTMGGNSDYRKCALKLDVTTDVSSISNYAIQIKNPTAVDNTIKIKNVAIYIVSDDEYNLSLEQIENKYSYVESTQPSIPSVNISTPTNKSSFKLNDWLGDGEVYENGLINKSWGRILLSEACDSILENIVKTNTYNFRIALKKSYSEYNSSITNYIHIKFKDFIMIPASNSDSKHLYMYKAVNVVYDVISIFIPRAEIDSFSGSSLNDKFINWMKENDDYVYYKKANSININPSIEGILTSYGEENNTISISENIKNCKLSIKENLNNGLSQTTENYSQTNGNKLIELEDKLQYTSKDKQNKDEEGYFEIIEEKRNDGSLLTKSTLKNKIDELYRERQVQIYDRYGKIIREIVFELTYDSDGSLMNENIISDSNKNI